MDLVVHLDQRPLIVVVVHVNQTSLLIDTFTDWMYDRYERRKRFRRINRRNKRFCEFDNTMISVSSYFICPKFYMQ